MVLAGLMFRASYWQADKHEKKIAYIEVLETRLKSPPEPITNYSEIPTTDWPSLVHRRLSVSCRYDYEHEMILRNRRYQEKPGAFVITPCIIDSSNKAVLVNRGFVSYTFMNQEARKKIQRPQGAEFLGLVKENMTRKMFSPKDPEAGPNKPWIDAWLRIDTAAIQRQIPYPILPIYLEIIPHDAPLVVKDSLLESRSGRDEMFFLAAGTENKIVGRDEELDPRYPIAVFDTVVPPGRHLGYIYEWAAMAIMTLLIGVILQMKRTIKID